MTDWKRVLLCLGLLLNYCSDSHQVSYGIRDFPESLDPSFGLSFDESQISSQIYENLISLNADCETLDPQLAVNWKVSENKCSYTFTLRDNVYFHDGTKLSAYSVLKSYDWLRRKEGRSEIFDKIKRLNIIDSLTFEFVLNEPYSIFLYVLASPESFQVMSEQALKKYGNSIGRHPVGTGPFYLGNWKDNKEIQLDKYYNYWGHQGQLDKIVFKYYMNTFQGEDYLEQNKIDILYSASSYSIDRLKWTGFINYHTFVPVSIFFIGFNNETFPFNNKRIRRAILEAINIPRFIHSSSRGKDIVAKGPLPPNFYEYSDKVQAEYNPENAKQILKDLGINNLDINFDYPRIVSARTIKIEYLKHELAKIGIHLKIHAHNSWPELTQAITSDSAQMFYDGGRSDIIGDGLNFLYGFFYSSSEFNTIKYNNPLVDKWIDEAFLEYNPEKRKRLYKKVVDKILDDTPAIFLSHVIPSLAYNKIKIKKIVTDPYGVIRFNEIDLY